MRHLVIVLVLAAAASACARRPRAQVTTPGAITATSEGARVEGQASYYGDPYHGRTTASGETFDKNKLTAAHRTLPFNTWVRVENRLNGKTVDVRINDRGPFVDGRVIDLSEGAARRIEMIRSGVVPVSLEIVRAANGTASREPDTADVFFVVQLGAFRSERSAQNLRRRFAGKYTDIYVDPPSEGSPFYKVRIGRALLQDARYVQDLLRREDEIEAIVVRME